MRDNCWNQDSIPLNQIYAEDTTQEEGPMYALTVWYGINSQAYTSNEGLFMWNTAIVYQQDTGCYINL